MTVIGKFFRRFAGSARGSRGPRAGRAAQASWRLAPRNAAGTISEIIA